MGRFRRPLNIRRVARSTINMVAVRKRRPHSHEAERNRERMRSFGVSRFRYLVAVPILLVLILLVVWIKTPPLENVRYRPVKHAITNPLMGWAVNASNEPEAVEIPHTLVHATMTWREIEPEEGQYAFEAFEEKNHFDEWRALGMRAIIRFVMDMPGEETEKDIPDWLYEGMGEGAGTFYDNWVGKGFSPNYDNLWLQQKHGEVLSKIGERYEGDVFVEFVELGSLGHNGEWWVDRSNHVTALPLSAEAKNYISAYCFAFPTTPMLAVNPYQSIKLIQAGLYNPFLGDADGTWNWIDMVTYGGYEPEIGVLLRGMGEFYKSVPSGAQIARQVSAQGLLAASPEFLIDQIRECHTTYVSGAPATNVPEDILSNMRIVQEIMGYRLWVRSAQWPKRTRCGENLPVSLGLRNSGVAPMSRSWPVKLSLFKHGEEVYGEITRVDVQKLLPGESRVETSMDIPINLPGGTYQIGLSILDPATGEPGVEMAMVSGKLGLTSILGEVSVG